MEQAEFVQARDDKLAALAALVVQDPRIEGLWLQGSLARADADPLSDIDAHLSIPDDDMEAVFTERERLLGSIAPIIAWSDATAPGLTMTHALLDGAVRVDLVFERASQVAHQKRPSVRILVDKTDLASRLIAGWEPPLAVIGHVIGVTIRMTRQGGTWPLRTLRRGQWSTFAMLELDLINGQLAQLLAVRTDPSNFYQNTFSLYRRLTADQQVLLDELTGAALAALTKRDTKAMLAVHLDVLDALVREGRTACAALGVPYPVSAEGDARLRRLLQDAWPSEDSVPFP